MTGIARAILAGTVATIVAACATDGPPAPAQPAAPELLKNAAFEAPAVAGRDCPRDWWCAMHNRTDSFKFEVVPRADSSSRFLKVTQVKEEPWALVTQTQPATALRGRRVRLSAAVHSPELKGEAGVIILVQNGAGAVVAHKRSLLKAGPGWRRATVELEIPAAAEIVEFGLLVEGGGWAGFDEASARLD